MMTRDRSILRQSDRKGVATVEFAFVVPIFLVLILGMIEVSRLLDTQNQVAVAAREGARLAAMRREGLLDEGQSINDKVADDIRHILTSNGLNGDAADIFIVNAEDRTTEFDLDDPDNDLELFELRIEIPYSAFNSHVIELPESMDIVSSVVFRNGRSKIVQ